MPLAQQGDVMDAVQRCAPRTGQRKSEVNEQMKVETQSGRKQDRRRHSASQPGVVYVPSYNPTVVWGAPPLPISSGLLPATRILAGAAIGSGSASRSEQPGRRRLGWGCGWAPQRRQRQREQQFVRNRTSTLEHQPGQYQQHQRPGTGPATTSGSTIRNIAARSLFEQGDRNKYGGSARGVRWRRGKRLPGRIPVNSRRRPRLGGTSDHGAEAVRNGYSDRGGGDVAAVAVRKRVLWPVAAAVVEAPRVVEVADRQPRDSRSPSSSSRSGGSFVPATPLWRRRWRFGGGSARAAAHGALQHGRLQRRRRKGCGGE